MNGISYSYMNVGFYCLVCCIIAHIITTINSSMFTNVSFKYDVLVTYTVYIFYFILAHINLMVTIGINNINSTYSVYNILILLRSEQIVL